MEYAKSRRIFFTLFTLYALFATLTVLLSSVGCVGFPKTSVKALCEGTETMYFNDKPQVKCGLKAELTIIEFGG